MPQIYKEAIRNEKIKIGDVKYIVIAEGDEMMNTVNFIAKISDSFGMSTTENGNRFYVILND